jgi:basic membrane lipoprotein Med (substrate-binding protein (PBP1-ABC) superfamily)/DNA-binding SARP family transcriptional activator
VEFGILGVLEATHGGRRLDVGPHKQRSLLALLLISANRVVSTDRILADLWGDDAEGKENALWVYVSRLRSVLEPERAQRGESNVLLTRGHGYMLSVDPGSIDAHRFEEAAARGRSLVSDDPDSAAEILREALRLWRGSALQDFAYQDFAQAEITRLEELRMATVEDRIEADLRRGQTGELVGELEAFQQLHPLRERPVAQLMLALYRSGRQADALRTFERFRRGVGEELGIEPSPELRRLEEQVLLHDSRIRARRPRTGQAAAGVASAVNPFKGLRAFHEADSGDFFGRSRLVADVVRRLDGGQRLIALVGPSGSGKSSVVRAGLIPSLRKGAATGSDGWLVAQMVPGSHPFAELEAALLRSSLDAPDTLARQLSDPEAGILRAALRVFPRHDSRLLLVIDQFEELFTLVRDENTRARFLGQLLPPLDDPHGRIMVVLTLRADFYDRPLAYPELGSRLGDGVVNVVPLTPDELEEAAQKPAERAGVALEPSLLAALLTDVVGRPGALPLFQYTLTALFDRRRGDTLTLDSYRAMAGVGGALTRHAEDLYAGLDPEERSAAKQLFLRLVTIPDSAEWGRRRVPASEIVSLDVDVVALQGVIDRFAGHRLLTLDRDFVTGSPTVEVAHEALLTAWERLRAWIEESREDVRRHASLTTAMNEWAEADNDPDYLLSGTRLEGYERWAASATMRLTTDERGFLDAAIEVRDQAHVAEQERVALEVRTARSAKRRLWGLAAALALLLAVGARLLMAAPAPGGPSVAVVYAGRGNSTIADLIASGLDDASRDFGIEIREITPPFTDLEERYRRLAESRTDLVIGVFELADPIFAVAADYPDTAWAVFERVVSPGVTTAFFAVEEGAYLVGAAAALTSRSGTIGFVGGLQFEQIERFRAGYEAGARAVNPDIEILATYVSAVVGVDGFRREDLAEAAAAGQYQRGADVVFHAAGDAGLGVFRAASEETIAQGVHLWAIGVDADQYLDVDPLLRRHVLTSMVKKFDVSVYTTIRDFLEGTLDPTLRWLTLADGALDFSRSGDHLSAEVIAEVNSLREAIVTSMISVPRAPTGRLDPPPDVEHFTVVTVTFDGARCSYEDRTLFGPDEAVRFDFANTTGADASLIVYNDHLPLDSIAVLAPGHGENSGFVVMSAGGTYALTCAVPDWDNWDPTFVEGPTLTVQTG